MNALPSSFVDEIIQSISSPPRSLSPESAKENQDVLVVQNVFSSTVLQAPSVIIPSTNTSTSWLQKSLERKKKRIIQLEAPNLDVIVDLLHRGAKRKKSRTHSKLVVHPTSETYLLKLHNHK